MPVCMCARLVLFLALIHCNPRSFFVVSFQIYIWMDFRSLFILLQCSLLLHASMHCYVSLFLQFHCFPPPFYFYSKFFHIFDFYTPCYFLLEKLISHTNSQAWKKNFSSFFSVVFPVYRFNKKNCAISLNVRCDSFYSTYEPVILIEFKLEDMIGFFQVHWRDSRLVSGQTTQWIFSLLLSECLLYYK